jgi:hypothetical protein
MQTRRAPPILRAAAVSGLLVVAGIALPGTAFGQTYGGGPGGIAPVAPPSAQPPIAAPQSVSPPGVPPSINTSEVAGRTVTAPQQETAPSAGPGSAAFAPQAQAPPGISEVAGRTVEQPAAVAQPAPMAEAAPRVVAPPPEIAEVAPRSVAAPPSEQVLARAPARQGPGLEAARVLPKAGEGLDEAGIWPPLVMALAAVAIGALGVLWPRLRRRATHSA